MKLKHFYMYKSSEKVTISCLNPNPAIWVYSIIFSVSGLIFEVNRPKLRCLKIPKIAKLSKISCLSKIGDLKSGPNKTTDIACFQNQISWKTDKNFSKYRKVKSFIFFDLTVEANSVV